ncbi:hypothetical protein [Acetobacter sp. UBA5411]|uniref:hypothetical protein n=1 Tax=Acetobacter sp. UBA5411 TaxID=1945905 RepID=UPI0025B8CFD7|nr:hypothetical protein [Acetobacter sp. UBA5411]
MGRHETVIIYSLLFLSARHYGAETVGGGAIPVSLSSTGQFAEFNTSFFSL